MNKQHAKLNTQIQTKGWSTSTILQNLKKKSCTLKPKRHILYLCKETKTNHFLFVQLCGLALIVVGILVQVALHNTPMIHDATASGGPIVVIIVGVVIFFIAFFGCCGAWKENYCMVTTVIHTAHYHNTKEAWVHFSLCWILSKIVSSRMALGRAHWIAHPYTDITRI